MIARQTKECEFMIGKKVCKESGKPFKSGKKVNTVKEVVLHPDNIDEYAFTFEEDDSYVGCVVCKEYIGTEWL